MKTRKDCLWRSTFLVTSVACGLITSLQAQTYASRVLGTPNLLGYWPFSPTSQADSVVNGYTGTFQGQARIGAPGSGPSFYNDPFNTALVLDRTNRSYVNTTLVGSLSATGPNANEGCIIAWFKLDTLPSLVGSTFTIAGESQYGNDFDLQIETDDKLKFYTDNASATVYTNAFTTNDLGKWFFVAGTFTASTSRSVYVNGQLVATSVPGGHAFPGSGTFAIGASDVFAGRYFQGSLDEIAVFNRELTATEIASFYAAADVGSGLPFISGIAAGQGSSPTIFYNSGSNSTNVLQATSSLQAPIFWRNIATNTAGANGAGQFSAVDQGTYPARFYRLVTP